MRFLVRGRHVAAWRSPSNARCITFRPRKSAQQTITYDVPDISSGHCRAAIEAEVGAVPGVETIRVDLEAATVAVTGVTLDDAAIRTAI